MNKTLYTPALLALIGIVGIVGLCCAPKKVDPRIEKLDARIANLEARLTTAESRAKWHADTTEKLVADFGDYLDGQRPQFKQLSDLVGSMNGEVQAMARLMRLHITNSTIHNFARTTPATGLNGFAR
jgi:phage shock protein A